MSDILEITEKQGKKSGANTKSAGRKQAVRKTAGGKASGARQKPDKLKAAARSPADKQSPRRKKSAAASPPAGKVRKRAASSSTAAAKSRKPVRPAASGESAAPEATPGDDPRSLAWMAESAVQALNAVKASQTKKAWALLENAQREKSQAAHEMPDLPPQALPSDMGQVHAPAVPEARPREGVATETPGNAVKPEMQTEPGGGTAMPMPSPPHSPPRQPTDLLPDERHAELDSSDGPTEPVGRDTAGSSNTESPEVTEPQDEPGKTLSVPPHVMQNRTQASTGRRLWWRPGTFAGVLILAGWLGYQWLPQEEDSGTTMDTPTAMLGTELSHQDEPASQAEDTSITSADSGSTTISDQPNRYEWTPALPLKEPEPEPAIIREPVVTGNPQPHTTPAEDTPATGNVAPKGDTAEKAKSATSPAYQPADVTTKPAARRTVPRPASRTTGYGYYPQQPARQQPYYRPGYSNYPPR